MRTLRCPPPRVDSFPAWLLRYDAATDPFAMSLPRTERALRQAASAVCRTAERLALALAVLGAAAGTAAAHELSGPMGGFASGFEHPISGPDHLLAMLSVGLWGAQMGGRPVWSLPVTFPLIMCIGGVLGITGLVAIPDIELGIACSILVLGGAIAAEWKAPEWAAVLIVAFFAIFHGYAHGLELPRAADPAAYAVGFVISTGMIHVIGIAIGLLVGRFYGGLVSRVIGGLIVVGGIYYFILAIG